MIEIFIVSFLLLFIIFFVVYFFWFGKRLDSLNLKTLLIKIPRDESGKEDLISQINLSEQLFASLISIKQPFTFEVAVHHHGGDIFFYCAVPRKSIDFITRQIQGFFPRASVEISKDYSIFSKNDFVSVAYAKPAEIKILPFRTYREAEADIFAPVVSTLSKLQEVGDGACLQVVLRPAGNETKKQITSSLEMLKRGEKLSSLNSSDWKDVFNSFFGQNKKATEKNIDEEAIKALQLKVSKTLYEANIRIVTSSSSIDQAEDLLMSIAGSLTQFTSPLRNSLKIVKPKHKRKRRLIKDYVFREFRKEQSVLLNAEELASFFHLPTFSTDVPRIKWLNTKEATPPSELPEEGVVLGESIFRGEHKLVKMAENDRRRHFYIIGQTGTGKSYLMLNMAKQDMEAGRGLCIIDPHGDLINKTLSLVPADRFQDIIVFDPGDISRPLGLNMLEYNFSRPQEKTFIVNEIQSIFNRLFDKETMGPMFEQYMRNALLLLMEDAKNDPATLMEVPRIFTDPAFRERKLSRINNPAVIDFWQKEASKTTGEQGLANITPYITSKFGNFVANDYMRPIIGQTESSFNFRQVMDEGKILLVNLAKGKIGDINAGLIGMIITGRLLLAALSRDDMEEEERRDFYLYIDEFQNFTTDSIGVILSEARKYKLNLTLAHQFIGQLTDPIKDSVFGNVGSMSSFRVGPQDAEFLVKHFGPTFSEKDLMSVENQNAFLKLLVNGEPVMPFNIKTLPLNIGSAEVRDNLKELSRLTYGKDLNEVERDILHRLRF